MYLPTLIIFKFYVHIYICRFLAGTRLREGLAHAKVTGLGVQRHVSVRIVTSEI